MELPAGDPAGPTPVGCPSVPMDPPDYLDPYYSVYHFRLAYGGVIKPLPDKSQWVKVDPGFKVLPPLAKKDRGRQWKNRIPSCLENKGNKKRGKGMWQVTCKNCLGLGHRSTSPKCPLNGTKKRKSRANKGKTGRPAGCTKGDAGPSSSKRQKVNVQENSVTNSPGPGPVLPMALTSQISTSPGAVTRSRMQLAIVEFGGTNQISTSPGAVTRSQSEEGARTIMTTPRKKMAVKKKLTPKKANKIDV